MVAELRSIKFSILDVAALHSLLNLFSQAWGGHVFLSRRDNIKYKRSGGYFHQDLRHGIYLQNNARRMIAPIPMSSNCSLSSPAMISGCEPVFFAAEEPSEILALTAVAPRGSDAAG